MSLEQSSITTTDREWLPMPSGISITSHDSFTKDLLYQFDKRRSQLLSNENYISSSIGNTIHLQVSGLDFAANQSLRANVIFHDRALKHRLQ